MDISLRRVDRGPGWDRWVIVESQHGDSGFAGEVIMTYSDTTSYAEMECTVLFARELNNEETSELFDSLSSILTGEGNVTIFTAHQLACRGFSLQDEDLDDYDDDDEA